MLDRTVANAAFLRVLLAVAPFDAYHFFLPGPNAAKTLHERLKAEFEEIEARPRLFLHDAADFLILWTCKQDLLEFCPSSGTDCA